MHLLNQCWIAGEAPWIKALHLTLQLRKILLRLRVVLHHAAQRLQVAQTLLESTFRICGISIRPLRPVARTACRVGVIAGVRGTVHIALPTTAPHTISQITDAAALVSSADIIPACKPAAAIARLLTATLPLLLPLTTLPLTALPLTTLCRLLTTAVARLAGLTTTLPLAALLSLTGALTVAAVLTRMTTIQRCTLTSRLHRLQLAPQTLHLTKRSRLIGLACIRATAACK